MAKSYRGTERAWATIRHSRCGKIRESNLTQKRVSRVGCSPGRGHPACCCCQAAPLRQGTHLLQLHRPPWYGLGYFLYFWELGWTYFWAIIGPFSALKKLNKFLTIETDWYSRMKYLGFVVREEGGNEPWGCHWWLQGHAPSWWQNKMINSSKKVSSENLFFSSVSLMKVQPGDCHVGKRDPLLLWNGEKLNRPVKKLLCRTLQLKDWPKKPGGQKMFFTWEPCCQRPPLLPPGSPPHHQAWVIVASFTSSSYELCDPNKILKEGVHIFPTHDIIEIPGPLFCWDKTREKVKQEVQD